MGGKPTAPAHIEASAIIHPTAVIGHGTRIWAFAQLAEYAVIGDDCVVGNGAYLDRHVKVGNRVQIHNKALLYQGVVVEDDVFIGPGVCFTNDRWPRSHTKRNMKDRAWVIERGASIGANATVLPDVRIGAFSMTGAGSVVTRAVPRRALVWGNPARIHGVICECGAVIYGEAGGSVRCPDCGKSASVPAGREDAAAEGEKQ